MADIGQRGQRAQVAQQHRGVRFRSFYGSAASNTEGSQQTTERELGEFPEDFPQMVLSSSRKQVK